MGMLALLLVLFTDFAGAAKKIARVLGNITGLVAGTILTLGGIAFYIGADRSGNVLIPAVIASAAPLVASLLSAIIDKERINVVKRIGAVIVVAGIVLLNIV
jgi:drug/metabolite transporter (DMT)-like permease